MTTRPTLDQVIRDMRAQTNLLTKQGGEIRELKAALARNGLRVDTLEAAGTGGTFVQNGLGAVIRTLQDKAREIVSLADFVADRSDGAEVYTGVLAALATLEAAGGGTLLLPPGANYLCDPVAQIEIGFDELTIDIQCAEFENVSTTGVGFFRFTGGGARQHVNFVGHKLKSCVTGGNMFEWDDDTGLGQFEWTCEIQQLNPQAHILYRGPSATSGGLFTGKFLGPQWDHGSGTEPGGASAPTVEAVYMEADLNMFNEVTFGMNRTNQHHGACHFFKLHNQSVGGAFWTRIGFRVGTIEQCSYGWIWAAGVSSMTVELSAAYDLDGKYAHLIQLERGDGLRDNEACRFSNFQEVSIILTGSLDVAGVYGPWRSSTITSVGTTATLTSNRPHGAKVGDFVLVRGAAESEYNGRFAVATVPSPTQITYVMGSDPVGSAATGTITMSKGTLRPATLTSVGTLATLTAVGHGYEVGQWIHVQGANEADYNGRFEVASTPTADTLTYVMAGDPASPATGSILVSEGATTIRCGPNDNRHEFGHVFGNLASYETMVDLNYRDATIPSANDRVTYARQDPSVTTKLEGGANASVRTPLVGADRLEPVEAAYIDWSPQNWITGCKHVWVSNTVTRIETPGRCRSDDDTSVVSVAVNLPVDITASGVGGLGNGASEAADTWYKVWLIWDSTDPDGTVDAIATPASDALTLPGGFDKQRFAGRFYNNSGSNIRKFKQQGIASKRTYIWDETEANLRALNAGSATAAADVVLLSWMPPESQWTHLLVGFTPNSAGNALTLVSADATAANWQPMVGQVAGVLQRQRLSMSTSSAQRVSYLVTNGSDDAWVYCLGFDLDL